MCSKPERVQNGSLYISSILHIEVISGIYHVSDKSYEKIQYLVQIDPWSRGVKWAITLVNMVVF